MKYLASLLFFCFCQKLSAGTFQELHRLNFFPASQAYLRLDYTYQNLEIETPRILFNQSSVRNYLNIFDLSYAFNWRGTFFGTKLKYEVTSLSAANYGIASSKRYTAQGFGSPEFFFLSRLRPQTGETGNIDLFFSFTPGLGPREIGKRSAERFEGRDIFQFRLSHGLREESWEFRNQLGTRYFSEGKETNSFTENKYILRPYALFRYSFTGQYQARDWLYIFAGASFEYRTVQKIVSPTEDERKIQAGTGSIFNLGVKKPLDDWSVVELGVELERYSYFVVDESNFDGQATDAKYSVSFIRGF